MIKLSLTNPRSIYIIPVSYGSVLWQCLMAVSYGSYAECFLSLQNV